MCQGTLCAVGHFFEYVAGEHYSGVAPVLHPGFSPCGMSRLKVGYEIRCDVQCYCPRANCAAGNSYGGVRQGVQGAAVNIACEIRMDVAFYIHVKMGNTAFHIINYDAAVLHEFVRAENVLYYAKAGFFIQGCCSLHSRCW